MRPLRSTFILGAGRIPLSLANHAHNRDTQTLRRRGLYNRIRHLRCGRLGVPSRAGKERARYFPSRVVGRGSHRTRFELRQRLDHVAAESVPLVSRPGCDPAGAAVRDLVPRGAVGFTLPLVTRCAVDWLTRSLHRMPRVRLIRI
jgi:hypothetical protein